MKTNVIWVFKIQILFEFRQRFSFYIFPVSSPNLLLNSWGMVKFLKFLGPTIVYQIEQNVRVITDLLRFMWGDSSISSIKFVKVVGNIPNLWKSPTDIFCQNRTDVFYGYVGSTPDPRKPLWLISKLGSITSYFLNHSLIYLWSFLRVGTLFQIKVNRLVPVITKDLFGQIIKVNSL